MGKADINITNVESLLDQLNILSGMIDIALNRANNVLLSYGEIFVPILETQEKEQRQDDFIRQYMEMDEDQRLRIRQMVELMGEYVRDNDADDFRDRDI